MYYIPNEMNKMEKYSLFRSTPPFYHSSQVAYRPLMHDAQQSSEPYYMMPRSRSFSCHAHADRIVSARVEVAFHPSTSLA